MTKADQFTDEKYNLMKQTEADLIRDLQAVVKEPEKETELSAEIFKKHQKWLQIINTFGNC